MKDNLKTFPKIKVYSSDVAQWKKRFERQLEELKIQWLNAYPLQNPVDKEVVFVVTEIFKEILGDY